MKSLLEKRAELHTSTTLTPLPPPPPQQQQQTTYPYFTTTNTTNTTDHYEYHEKILPTRKQEHVKLKIIPKRIYDSLQ